MAVGEESPPRDARSLVERMVAAGEWPEPALMEQIVAAGDEAVEPLLEVLRTEPEGWPEEAPLRTRSACSARSVRPVRSPPWSTSSGAIKNDTARCGRRCDRAIRSRRVRGSPRTDPGSLDRRLPAIALDHRRPQRPPPTIRTSSPGSPSSSGNCSPRSSPWPASTTKGGHRALELDGRYDADDEIAMNAIPPDDDLAHLAEKLSAMADPLAVDMIQAGFEEGLVSHGNPGLQRHQGRLRGRRPSPFAGGLAGGIPRVVTPMSWTCSGAWPA